MGWTCRGSIQQLPQNAVWKPQLLSTCLTPRDNTLLQWKMEIKHWWSSDHENSHNPYSNIRVWDWSLRICGEKKITLDCFENNESDCKRSFESFTESWWLIYFVYGQ